MKSANIRLIVIIIITFIIGYYFGVNKVSFDWNNFQPTIQVSSKEPPPSDQSMDMSRMWTVLEKLETMYYDKSALNANKMLDGAIVGMVSSLGDPYTVYLPPQQNSGFKQELAGEFDGIGAELGMKGKDIVVIAPLDDSPAAKAGIKAGDIILGVNDKSIIGIDLNTVVNEIRGPKDTSVTLTIEHKGSTTPVDIKIERNTITVKSLTTWTKQIKDIQGINTKAGDLAKNANDKIIYIRLSEFGDNTDSEWQQIAQAASQQIKSDKSIKGIVFDLRNNPGGYLNDAIEIISEFVQSGTAVQQEDSDGKRTAYPVSGKGQLTDVPVVVLINKGSASASEIVSGALQDHHRATLVGDGSFGKGIIEQAEDLGNGAGLHITIAKWLTPNGNWVGNGKDGKGLTPDIKVSLDPKDPSHDTQLEKAVEVLVQ